MDKLPILIHIGMHKTGTSFLQKEVFPNVENALYSRNKSLRDYYHRGNGEAIVISDEILSGNPFTKNTMQDFRWKINILKSMFSEATILVCFREPVDYILSLYKQFLHEGGTVTFDEFFNLDNTGILRNEDINYKERIEILNQNFDDVVMYDFSLFKQNPQHVFDQVGKRMNLKFVVPLRKKGVNVGISKKWQVNMLRNLNKVLGFTYKSSRLRRRKLTPRNLIQGKLSFINGAKWDIDDGLKKEIINHFSSEWIATKSLIIH